MNLEQLDGFLAALVCGPDEVLRSAYLSEIWADIIVNEDAFLARPLLRGCVKECSSVREVPVERE
jgi:uncharacterized protein